MLKKVVPQKNPLPSKVVDIQEPDNIASLFKDQFDYLVRMN